MSISKNKAQDHLAEAVNYYHDADAVFRDRAPFFRERIAFYRGMQWGDTTPWGWFGDGDGDDEAREVYNYVRPTVRSAVADKIASVLTPDSVPVHSDMRAHARSIASHRLMKSFLRTGVFPFEELYRATLASIIHGASWLKASWDTSVGPFLRVPIVDEQGVETLGEDNLPKTEVSREGDARIRMVDVYDALPDPLARSSSEIRHIFHRKLVPVSVLDDRYPEDAFGRKTKGRWPAVGSKADLFGRDAEDAGQRFSTWRSASNGNREAELIEFWEQPTFQYPGGRMLVYVGSDISAVLLAVGPLPFGWPWVMLPGENMSPGALYPDGTVNDVIPLQRTINLDASKTREWVDKILSPPLLNPEGSGISADLYTDMAGEVIPYNPGHKPEWMAVPGIPPSMLEHLDRSAQILKDVSGYSDISRGQAAPGLESARAVSTLDNLENRGRAAERILYRQAVSSALVKALTLYRDFCPEGKMVRIFGANGKWLVRPFKRDDYDFETEIIVEPWAQGPTSRSARFSERLEAYQAGMYADTDEAKAVRRELALDADDSSTVDPEHVHRERNMAEQQALIDGEYDRIFVLPQDDHEIHLDGDDLWMVTAEFLELDPQLQDFYRQHAQQHEQMRSQQLQTYAYEQQLLGGGSQPGGPSAPGGTPASTPGVAPSSGGHAQIPGAAEGAASQQQLRAQIAPTTGS